VLAGIESGKDGIDDTRGAVHDIERWMKSMFGDFA
jgi:hypothetical protein